MFHVDLKVSLAICFFIHEGAWVDIPYPECFQRIFLVSQSFGEVHDVSKGLFIVNNFHRHWFSNLNTSGSKLPFTLMLPSIFCFDIHFDHPLGSLAAAPSDLSYEFLQVLLPPSNLVGLSTSKLQNPSCSLVVDFPLPLPVVLFLLNSLAPGIDCHPSSGSLASSVGCSLFQPLPSPTWMLKNPPSCPAFLGSPQSRRTWNESSVAS